MIVKDLKIFSQNIQKNNLIINTILEANTNFNIIFIQEPSCTTIRSIPSSKNSKGIPLVGIPNHSNWLTFARDSNLMNNSSRVITYININLSSLCFSLRKDLINHKDILLISFFNNNICFYIINVYSDSSYSALKYLKDTKVNIQNLLIMTGDFNIRDSLWDPSFSYHSSISDDLIIVVDSFNLDLLIPTNQVPTRYSDIAGKSNSVIDLMFLRSRSNKLNNHLIHPDWWLILDHAPLTITIPIIKENINSFKFSIMKNNKEEVAFIKEVVSIIKNLDVSNLMNSDKLEDVINIFASNTECAWKKNSKCINIIKNSKSWWNNKCSQFLGKYRTSRNLLRKWSRLPRGPSLILRYKKLPIKIEDLGSLWAGLTSANYQP